MKKISVFSSSSALAQLRQRLRRWRRPSPTSSPRRCAASRPRWPRTSPAASSVACIGVWTALNARYRKNGSALCRSMNATASRPKASVRYSFSSTGSVPRRIGSAPGREVSVRAAEEAEELVEAALLRVELPARCRGATCRPGRWRSRPPSAGRRASSRVSGSPSRRGAVAAAGVELVAEPLSGSGRSAARPASASSTARTT